MNVWKSYILAGNKCFASDDLESAQDLYLAARKEAENLFCSWREPDEAVSALVVTNLNIADLYQKQGQTQTARTVFERIHRFILHAVTSTPISDRRHKALYEGSIKTYAALINHKANYKLKTL